MLKHKKDVDSKDVCDTKKCVCHKHLLTTRNTKKCVCLEGNRNWLKDARERNRCWVKCRSALDQISTRLLINFNQYTVNSLAFTANWLEFDLWHIRNSRETFKEWRWTANLDWIQWSWVNYKFDILIELTAQLFFLL